MSSPTDEATPVSEDPTPLSEEPAPVADDEFADPYVTTTADFLLLLGTALVVALTLGAFLLVP